LTTAIEGNQLKAFPDSILANLLGEKPIRLMGGEGMDQLFNDGGLADPWQACEQDVPSHLIPFNC
jgi:hypothetical protein